MEQWMRGGRGGWDREERTDTEKDGWGWGAGPVHVVVLGEFFALVASWKLGGSLRTGEVRVQIFHLDRKVTFLPPAPGNVSKAD